jgi:ATP-dependent exoDNAse (exonuclease V) beta subunit
MIEETGAVSLSGLADLDREAYRRVQRLLRISRYSHPSRFVRQLYEELDLFSVYPGREAQLLAFLDFAHTYEGNRDDVSLDDFIRFIDEQGDTITLPTGGQGGVSVQTIHTAKGLEYHTVFLPFLTQTMAPRLDGSLLYNRDDEGNVDRFILARHPYPGYYPEPEVARELIEENALSHRIDEINTLYVALTRARENLVIFPLQGGKGETIGDSLLHALDGQPDESGAYALRIGDPVGGAHRGEEIGRRVVGIRAEKSAMDRADTAVRRVWVHPLPGEEAEGASGRAEVPAGSRERAREGLLRGLLFHAVVERIRALPVGDEELERRIAAALFRVGGQYSLDERTAAKAWALPAVRNTVADPRLGIYFNIGAFSETILLSRRYQNFLARIDRLLVGDEVSVLDFKTNAVENEETLVRLSDVYREQVRTYCDALAESFPERPVKGFLYFTEVPHEQRLIQVYDREEQ